MIVSTLRVFAEAGGLVAAGIAAGEVAPYLHDPDFEKQVETKCAPFIKQSSSLAAEFMDILRKLDASSYAKLTEVCCTNAKKPGAVSKADMDELCSNLANGDVELINFPAMFVEAEMEATASGANTRVEEQYRLIPVSEVAKLAPPPVDQPPSSSASQSSSGWYRARGSSAAAAGVRVTDVLSLMTERDRLASDLLGNFELQQQRIGR
jgi:hypothetical protein